MLSIAQTILQEIAQSECIEHPLIRELFSTSKENIQELEEMVIQDTRKELETWFRSKAKYHEVNFAKVARRIWEIIPLILECNALSHYMKQNNRQELREKLPYISNAREGIRFLQRKYPFDSTAELELIEWAVDHFHKDHPVYPKLGYYSH